MSDLNNNTETPSENTNVIDNEANDIINSIDLPELNLNNEAADVNDFVLTDKNESPIVEETEEEEVENSPEVNIEPVEVGLNSLEAQMINSTHEALDRVHDDNDSDASSDYNISSPKLQLQNVELEAQQAEPAVRFSPPELDFDNEDDLDIDQSFAQNFINSSNEQSNEQNLDEVNVDDVSLDSANQNTVDSGDNEARNNADQVCIFLFCFLLII
jgi:hypothetical protein